MADDGQGWLLRYHPFGYGMLALLFALPAVFGVLTTWPNLADLPSLFPGHWRTVVLFSTLISVGMGLRSVTPAANLAEHSDDAWE